MILPYLEFLKFGQFIRSDGPESHFKKEGTPTMGGIIFLTSLIITAVGYVVWDFEVLAVIMLALSFAGMGFVDDYIKVSKKRSLGLKAYQKLILQFLIAGIFAYFIGYYLGIGTEIIVPFMGGATINLGMLYIPFIVLTIVATVNSVNLTDGLDGLATSVTIPVLIFLGIMSLGMNISSLVFAFLGSLLGYLIFNSHPAKVFMGDLGSHAIGGFVVGVAIVLKMPLFILIFGIIYLMESLSVMLQVTSFKLRKKRIFKMSPIHHHFELLGWHETKVVWIFFVISIIATIVAFIAAM